MTSLFDDLKQGLDEAIEYEKGHGRAKTSTFIITPVKEYSSSEIRSIRMNAGMTQTALAGYMGVSKKTVEAWEGGRTHPTGPVFRLLSILQSNSDSTANFIRIVK